MAPAAAGCLVDEGTGDDVISYFRFSIRAEFSCFNGRTHRFAPTDWVSQRTRKTN